MIEIRRMWNGGPLRQCSDEHHNGFQYYEHTDRNHPELSWRGYTGAYVCEGCQKPCAGVYRVLAVKKWLCGGCRKAVRPSKRRSVAETPVLT